MNPYEHEQHTTYERLRGSLVAWSGTKQVIMVASAVHGEGTTTVTSRLAATMARTSIGDVLAVDLNLARPQLHEVFGVKNSVGLKEMLRGRAELGDVLQSTEFSNLKCFRSEASKVLNRQARSCLTGSEWTRMLRGATNPIEMTLQGHLWIGCGGRTGKTKW